MNAKQMLAKLDGYGGIIPFNSEELEVTLRALRLLAAAEANDGSIPEMTKAVQEGRGIELGCQFERERNALAARVAELEAKVRLLNIFKGCAMDAIEAHEITNQGDHDVIGALIGIDARSK